MTMQPIFRFKRATFAVAIFSALLAGCAAGPDYVRPVTINSADMPTSFKEDFKTAEPQDMQLPEQWWQVFNDPTLNDLIAQATNANQTLASAEASYRQASALLDNARAAYLPSITGNAAHTRARNLSTGITKNNTASLSANWELDIWGGVRRAVEAQENTALSSYANVGAVRLSIQAQLAQDYLQLRVLDVQQALLNRTVDDYQRALTLTQNQYKSGIVATDSVLLAETQLRNAEAQALDNGILRAQLEHAIAILVGKTPAQFSIKAIAIGDHAYMPNMPQIPVGVPSQLLERRADVAAAERTVAAANAQIGVTKAAYFPTLTLGATGGYQSSSLANWLSLPNRIWSIGPALAATLFDGGAKMALNRQAIAAYDASVANYRQIVLTSFQNVEDNLVALRILEQEAKVQHAATIAAKKSLAIAMNQYKAGTVSYLNVVTAQTTAFNTERTELTITNSRLTATVNLIKALGGGWQAENKSSASTQ